MTRKHPNARRAVALALFASFLFTANACALFHPDPVQAETAVTSPKRPLPGDPNIPDEGGRTTVTATTTVVAPQHEWFVYWVKNFAYHVFHAR